MIEPINDDQCASEADWEQLLKNMFRAELMREGISYKVLLERLAKIGIVETEANLRNKISRGRFTAMFFLQCLVAIGVDWLRIPGPPIGEMQKRFGAQELAQHKRPQHPPINS